MNYEMKGYVVSDLHIFSNRSYAHYIVETMYMQLKEADFLVLNGDIFDFSWTVLDSIDQTISEAVQWLRNLSCLFPKCHIYYILGNHDDLETFVKKIRAQSNKIINLSVCETHLVLGDNLFMHGDLPLAAKNPWMRRLKTELSKKHVLFHNLYDYVIKCCLHKLVYSYFSPDFCAKRICNTLQQYPKLFLKNIRHIYFGHTHLPFYEYAYNGFLFYNTGSTISGVNGNLIKVIYASK